MSTVKTNPLSHAKVAARPRGRPSNLSKFLARQGDLFADAQYRTQLEGAASTGSRPHQIEDAVLAPHAEGVGCQNARTARSEARTERTDLAINSAFFDARKTPEIFHQRRSSTADESGLQD